MPVVSPSNSLRPTKEGNWGEHHTARRRQRRPGQAQQWRLRQERGGRRGTSWWAVVGFLAGGRTEAVLGSVWSKRRTEAVEPMAKKFAGSLRILLYPSAFPPTRPRPLFQHVRRDKQRLEKTRPQEGGRTYRLAGGALWKDVTRSERPRPCVRRVQHDGMQREHRHLSRSRSKPRSPVGLTCWFGSRGETGPSARPTNTVQSRRWLNGRPAPPFSLLVTHCDAPSRMVGSCGPLALHCQRRRDCV